MKRISSLFCCVFLTSSAYALHWDDLWHTPDQQGAALLQAGKANEAAVTFQRPDWQAVSYYRAGEYQEAYKQFVGKQTSDNQYNAGNAAALSGEYQLALAAYDKALQLNPSNQDASANRDVVKKLLAQQKQSQQQQANRTKKNRDKKPEQQHSQPNTAQQKNNADPAQSAKSPQQKPQLAQADTAKEEAKRQLLRRVDDDPGSLLQRKFLRDYLKRHADTVDQGMN